MKVFSAFVKDKLNSNIDGFLISGFIMLNHRLTKYVCNTASQPPYPVSYNKHYLTEGISGSLLTDKISL